MTEETLIDRILAQMLFDDEDDSTILETLYTNSNTQEKALLDKAFVAVCGWTLETLIAGNITVNG